MCVCVCVCVMYVRARVSVCVCKHLSMHNITTGDAYICMVCFQVMIAVFNCVLFDVVRFG